MGSNNGRINQEFVDARLAIVRSDVRFFGRENLAETIDERAEEHENSDFSTNQAMAVITYPRGNTAQDDDGQNYLSALSFPDNPVNIVGYSYKSGGANYRSVTQSLNPGWVMKLDDKGKFDFLSSYYTLTYYRSNFTVEFYADNGAYLGKLVTSKDRSSWSRGDDSTFSFYDENGSHILEIRGEYFAGRNYGNGAIGGSLDLSDPEKIKLLPTRYDRNSHYFSSNHTFYRTHPFAEAASIKLVSVYQRVGYGNSAAHLKLGQFGSMYRIAGRV